MEPPATAEAMSGAAGRGDLPELRRLLAAGLGLAATKNTIGHTPLWHAVVNGKAGAVRLLLDAAPAAAMMAGLWGTLPLHAAARMRSGGAEVVRLLLEAAPATALTADVDGWLPLHAAASRGNTEAVRLLLEAAPEAATAESDHDDLPLELALDRAAHPTRAEDRAHCLETARLLLPAAPPQIALPALEEAGTVALALYGDLAACTALSPAQWQRVPAPCPALGAALPVVLARSAAEAALLVGHLPAEVRQRLRTGALCLARAQRECLVELPAVLTGQMLALAVGP